MSNIKEPRKLSITCKIDLKGKNEIEELQRLRSPLTIDSFSLYALGNGKPINGFKAELNLTSATLSEKATSYLSRIDALISHVDANLTEWESGDKCLISTENYSVISGCDKYVGQEGVIVSFHKNKRRYDLAFVEFDDGGCFAFRVEMLRKPETAAQKLKREKLESAYDLYCEAIDNSPTVVGSGLLSMEEFNDDFALSTVWLSIVDKTKYRK